MKKHFLKILILLIFISCNNDVTIKHYDTGEIKSKIYFVKNDTLRIFNYTKSGILLKEKIFNIEKEESIEVIYGIDSLSGNKDIIINKKGKKYGIIRHYRDTMVIQKELYIKNIPLGITMVHAGLLNNTQPDKDYFYRLFQLKLLSSQSKYKDQGVLEYNKDNQIVKEKSLGYIVHSKDTIKEGDSFTYEIEFIDGKLRMDSVFYVVYLGELDTNGVLVDTINSEGDGGWVKKCKFTIDKPEIGYNLITGNINALGIQDSALHYNINMLFYHDFYVKR